MVPASLPESHETALLRTDGRRHSLDVLADSAYDAELQRLHETFSPLVKRSKELGRAMRIGISAFSSAVNSGSRWWN